MMDEKKLEEILSNSSAPEADENAKKRAVNLAVAAFEQENKEKSKNIQGSSIWARLIGKTNPNDRSSTMEKKTKNRLIYGGLATAAALAVFTAPVLYQYLESPDEFVGRNSRGNNFAHIAQNVTTSVPSIPFIKQKKPNKAAELNAVEFNLTEDNEGSVQSAPETKPVQRGRHMQEESLSLVESIAPVPTGHIRTEIQSLVDDNRQQFYQDEGRDKFQDFETNPFKQVNTEPVSTFSLDVDTSSYSFVRSELNNGRLPQKDSVRIEEMINYFDYNYPLPESREQPFKPTVTVLNSPWAEGKKLMHIGIKGFDIEGEKPKSNLVFLIDVSGSMNSPDKLPLLVNSLKMLVDNLDKKDTVSIVVYAGAAGAVLEPTSANNKSKIYNALNSLSAGGSTAGAAGINLAYQLAEENFDENAVNRVILATDGDFNVGITNRDELQDFIERKRDTGIYLSVLGFGRGNYNDYMMQTLAQNGNGIAAYIDTLSEARKILVEEASSSLFPIAKDVKIQVEFNPETVAEYRLVGYETRALKREDFNNDKVDAGDIGAGHKVTAIYEITPVGSENRSIDPLRYESTKEEDTSKENLSDEYAFLKIRYKLPKETKSTLLTTPVTKANEVMDIESLLNNAEVNSVEKDIVFSITVASFAQLLKGGQYTGDLTYEDIIRLANASKAEDPYGYRSEFVQLVRLAKTAPPM